nr:MCP four helix bundle domain-containing protein [uncultured Arsenicibacter sp.]
MKWSFVIQQKLKAALLLSGIMAIITLNTFISRKNIRSINQSFSSIYADRLMPAIDMVYLTESLFTKRIALQKQMILGRSPDEAFFVSQQRIHQGRIDSLLTAYEKTFLVDGETRGLQLFKQQLARYNGQERDLLTLYRKDKAQALDELVKGRSAQTFQALMGEVHELTAIQSAEGRALMMESKSESSVFNLVSMIQIVSAIVVGLLILGLIHQSKLINKDSQPFHLN